MIAFITGLTTGGLSCLALQGGLLASSLANQIEQDMKARSGSKKANGKFRPQIAQPIALFLFAKLIAYTALGFLLGALGSVLQLSPTVRAILMFAIGIFMIGNALRMLNVHPIFRYFVFEPPAALTRYIRRLSKNNLSMLTPLLLGAMTVLIPCGVAQGMMAAALGTGDPLQGGMLMFAFTLGTTPVFFAIAYFATRLGATLEKYFNRIVAVTLLILGLVSINSGLNLAGSPVSFSKLFEGFSSAQTVSEPTALPGQTVAGDYVVNVLNNGYSPQTLHLPAGQPLTLTWVSNGTRSCALAVVVPALNYQEILPSTGQVNLEIPAQQPGTVIRYSCSMGMYVGQFVFDQ